MSISFKKYKPVTKNNLSQLFFEHFAFARRRQNNLLFLQVRRYLNCRKAGRRVSTSTLCFAQSRFNAPPSSLNFPRLRFSDPHTKRKLSGHLDKKMAVTPINPKFKPQAAPKLRQRPFFLVFTWTCINLFLIAAALRLRLDTYFEKIARCAQILVFSHLFGRSKLRHSLRTNLNCRCSFRFEHEGFEVYCRQH